MAILPGVNFESPIEMVMVAGMKTAIMISHVAKLLGDRAR
jgi:hypothetical protein